MFRDSASVLTYATGMRFQLKTPARWPYGWQRTAPHMRKSRGHLMGDFEVARDLLLDALIKLGARDIVLTHDPLVPYLRTTDVRVAVYFNLNGRPYVIAQDQFVGVVFNIRSIGIAVQSLLSLKRHGGGVMMQKAFDGFTAL